MRLCNGSQTASGCQRITVSGLTIAKALRAVLWLTSLSLMAITVRSQRMDKRCPGAWLLLSGAVDRSHNRNTKSLCDAFSRSFSRGATPLLGFFHPLLGCSSSLIVAFQKVLQLGINPDKCVKGL